MLLNKENQSMQNKFEPLSFEEADKLAETTLKKMTLEEKIAYTGGDRYFFIRPMEHLGLSDVYFTDATQGIHIREDFKEANLAGVQPNKSTAFPSAIALAATWNPNLSYEYAKAIGEECRAAGIGVLLGPGMNIYRVSQCGRNFEYFGEDPFLASRFIEAYVEGVQSTGTVATIKHFVANNTDFFRRKSNSIMDERTLHEIYIPAFQAGIDAGAKAVMTSYNLFNGEWCGQSNYVITELLRNRLGFEWMVMTDWWSVDDGEALAKSGQDLEMPFAIALEEAQKFLDEGKIFETDIDKMVKNILRTCYAMKLYDRNPEPKYYDTFPAHVETALETARESIVLLKNENSILPLNNNQKSILLTGKYVEEIISGGGSGVVAGYDHVTMLEAIKNEFGNNVEFVEAPTIEQIKNVDVVLCNIGTEDSEGFDRPFELPVEQENFVKLCVENNPNTVVIVTSGSGIKMTDWNNDAVAILYVWYGGQIGSVAIAEILSGKVNPSGKLPMTIEKEFKDSPAFGYMQGEEFYSGWNSEGEKAHPIYDVEYKEGIFVGYRWYENKNIEPLYHFGAGLSYTTFEYKNIELSNKSFNKNDKVTVNFTIKNNGNVDGAETAMVFINDVESSVLRPAKELKGFEKVHLKTGTSKEVSIILDKMDFSFWDESSKEWKAEKGEFNILICSSANNIQLTKSIELK